MQTIPKCLWPLNIANFRVPESVLHWAVWMPCDSPLNPSHEITVKNSSFADALDKLWGGLLCSRLWAGTRDTVGIRHGSCCQRAHTHLQVCVLPWYLPSKPASGSVPVLGHSRSQSVWSYCCKLGCGWLRLRLSKRPTQFQVKLLCSRSTSRLGYHYSTWRGKQRAE